MESTLSKITYLLLVSASLSACAPKGGGDAVRDVASTGNSQQGVSGPGDIQICPSEPGTVPGGTILINSGETVTTSTSVNLTLGRGLETLKMKISNDANCGCGTWEKYAETKAWTLSSDNERNVVSVQYKDYEGRVSACAVAEIVHDNLPPSMQIVLDPHNTYIDGGQTLVHLTVADSGVGVQSVSCLLNGSPIACSAGSSDLTFANSTGSFTLEVSATDNLNLSRINSVAWTVSPAPTTTTTSTTTTTLAPPTTTTTLAPPTTTSSSTSTTSTSTSTTTLAPATTTTSTTSTSTTSTSTTSRSTTSTSTSTSTSVTTTTKLPTTTTTMIPTTTTTTLNSHVVRQDYQIKSNKKVDILIVDDNSGSMEYEQRSMAKRMSTFLNQLSGLDWRVAVTTTDPRSSAIWGDGRIVEMKGLPRQYFIDSSMDSDRAQKILGNTLQRPETGSPYEQGIYATYRAIERSFMTSKEKACSCTSSHASSTNYGKNSACRSPNQDFFRDDANFATIVISDEDESKKKEKNIPENLLKFVKSTWKDKNFAFHSIVTRPGDVACKKGHGASYGNIYARMSQLTGNGTVGGAIIGSVCETDYGSQLAGIGDSVQQMQRVIPLKCAPIGSSTSSVVVWLNGSNYTASYEVQGDRLVFSSRLPAGQYSLEYRCP